MRGSSVFQKLQSVVTYKQSVIAWLRPLILPKNKQLPDHGWYQLLIILAVSALCVTGLTLAGRRPDARSVESNRHKPQKSNKRQQQQLALPPAELVHVDVRDSPEDVLGSRLAEEGTLRCRLDGHSTMCCKAGMHVDFLRHFYYHQIQLDLCGTGRPF